MDIRRSLAPLGIGGPRIQLTHIDYTGGHPSHPGAAGGLVLIIDDDGTHLRRLRELFVIPWEHVTGVDVQGPDQREQRLTATRMATLGPAAWAAKKTTSDAHLHIETADYSVGFQVPKTSAGQLRSQLARWTSRIPDPHDNDAPPPPTGPPAGWYPDPQGVAAQRWWDGTRWTGHTG